MFRWRKSLRKLVLGWLIFVPAVASLIASGDDFYQRLYQRGMAHFAAGEYEGAYADLRRAAFGFVEQVDTFETAQAYASIAAHHLGHDNDARDSLMRIVGAEKVQPHFRSVKLPDAVRSEIDTIAATLLTAQESTLLGVATPAQDSAAASKPVHDGEPKPAETPPQPAPTAKPVIPESKPVIPAPQPAAPSPRPVISTKPQTPKPIIETPKPQPQPLAAVPKPTIPATQPSPSAGVKLADAQKAADNGDVGRARSIYNELLSGPPLAHEQTLRLAEGLFLVRDFASAAKAFQRAGTFGHGEEPYRYDYALSLYETGHYNDAKRELAASLPYIPATPDVARNRAKIEGAIE
jgi:tetratricopeptide (TPR) repeat protein